MLYIYMDIHTSINVPIRFDHNLQQILDTNC